MGAPIRHSARAAREAPEHLAEQLREGLAEIDGVVGEGLPAAHRARLATLRVLVRAPGAVIAPRLDPLAPLGHTVPELDALLGGGPGAGLEALEELADLGLLERELANLVHSCPGCGRAWLNFRECCPGCGGFDLTLGRLVHHFRCAYQGLEAEFAQGADLVCPKCRRVLNQLGQDFERPHEAYHCNGCARLFEEPALDAQCVHCARTFPASESRLHRIHAFRATALAARAVELNRLTDLDLAQMLFDSELRLDSGEFLLLEAKREVHRLQRHGVPLSAGMVVFELDGRPYPIYREWDAGPLSRLGELLTQLRFPLDMIARMGSSRLGVLLPHTDAAGRETAAARYLKILRGLQLASADGRALEPLWVGRTWTSTTTTVDDVLEFLHPGEKRG